MTDCLSAISSFFKKKIMLAWQNQKNWFDENKKMGGSSQKIVFLVKICLFLTKNPFLTHL